MNTLLNSTADEAMRSARGAWRGTAKWTWWSEHREATLNWLALGLLLAAWNASDNEAQRLAATDQGRVEQGSE